MISVDRAQIANVMVVALANEIQDGEVVGVGLGTPLALAAALLARATTAPSVHILAGGVLDARVDLATYLGGAITAVGHTPGFVSHFESMDMAERQAMTLQFLRPAQVDGRGNLNTSRIGDRRSPQVRFPGGLATADVPTLLPRLVAYLPNHSVRNLPDRVSFRTGAGGGWSHDQVVARGIVTLVTDLAVIRHDADGATLVSVHRWTTPEKVCSLTGFRLAAPAAVPISPEPNQEQVDALAAIDSGGIRTHEIKSSTARVQEEVRK
jgi:glutaconate CoA-transferase subunit B